MLSKMCFRIPVRDDGMTDQLGEAALALLQLCQLLHEAGHGRLCPLHALRLWRIRANHSQDTLYAPNPARVLATPQTPVSSSQLWQDREQGEASALSVLHNTRGLSCPEGCLHGHCTSAAAKGMWGSALILTCWTPSEWQPAGRSGGC